MHDISADGRLIFDGTLTVRDAAALCATLLETIEHHRVISIDCSATTAVDASFIQLLVAARKTAARDGKTLHLATWPDGAMLDALTRGGFHITPPDPAEARHAWFEGDAA